MLVGSSVTLDDLQEIVGVVPEDAEDNGTQEEGNPAAKEREIEDEGPLTATGFAFSVGITDKEEEDQVVDEGAAD